MFERITGDRRLTQEQIDGGMQDMDLKIDVLSKPGGDKKNKEIIKATRVSGVENESVSQFTGDMYQQVNIYDNQVPVFGKNFVSPLANNGFAYYKYYLMDSELGTAAAGAAAVRSKENFSASAGKLNTLSLVWNAHFVKWMTPV